MEPNFSFGYLPPDGKRKIRVTIPYNPIEAGFEVVGLKACCFFFRKGDIVLRIKAATKIPIIQKKGSSRTLKSSIHPPDDQEQFIKFVKQWL